MSLRTRINSFTAWINLRLKPYDHLMNNVVMDLLTGTNMRTLMQSFTGQDNKKIQSFDGLTQQQKMTRIEWVIDELKKYKLVPEDLFVDTRMFAMRSADHIFSLLWRLITHDCLFVWDRLEYLLHESDEVLCEVPFKWIPEPPPSVAKKKKKKAKSGKKSLLSGFGPKLPPPDPVETEAPAPVTDSNYEPFPQNDYMKKFKMKPPRTSEESPPPEDCVMEMINKHLKMVHEGRKLNVVSLDDMVDSRVLCALSNSIIPNLFPTEILLNDRWTINLVLRTMEKLFYAETPFDSEDLVEADQMSVCSYFIAFFMLAYKFRQSKAVVSRMEFLKKTYRDIEHDLDILPPTKDPEGLNRKELEDHLENIGQQIQNLDEKFDIEFCYTWMEHMESTVRETHDLIRQKIKDRFDIIPVPRNISISDICLSLVINLSLLNSTGFYQGQGKEVYSNGKKLVLRDINTDRFIDDFSEKGGSEAIKKLLHLNPRASSIEIDVSGHQRYEFYFEAASRNKQLRAGSNFLYQVFPTNTLMWQKIFLRAVKENDIETVERMVVFFRTESLFLNCKEPHTGNSPLHMACRMGNYDIAIYLLENGANIDQRNAYKQTPLFSACEGLSRELAFLLIEWGCDVHAKGPRGMTAFETIKNDDFRDFLIQSYEHYSTVVPSVMAGNVDLLQDLVTSHIDGTRKLSSLRSRCINGSTLMHTAAYFNCHDVIRLLLKVRIDVNLLDYKGATPLHRAKNLDTMKLLMEAGARVSVEDAEGNTPLHVKCYGESGQPSEMDAIHLLLEQGARMDVRNNRSLLPIHCCAMQGRIDVIHLLLTNDETDTVRRELDAERGKSPPSLMHLAVANDFLECALWLMGSGFDFKDGEQDLLIRRVLTEQISVSNKADTVRFLLDHGASPNLRYPGGNTAVHYAACSLDGTDVLETLISYGADVDVTNDEHASALFFACQTNNQFAASILLSHAADVRLKNLQGLSAFDFIMDYDEWIECGYFNDEIRARLKAYSLKHSRDLIRAITKKVKSSPAQLLVQADHVTTAGTTMTATTSGPGQSSVPQSRGPPTALTLATTSLGGIPQSSRQNSTLSFPSNVALPPIGNA